MTVITDEELPAWRHGLQTGIDSEREAIVEWLRGCVPRAIALEFSDAIERGDHLPSAVDA